MGTFRHDIEKATRILERAGRLPPAASRAVIGEAIAELGGSFMLSDRPLSLVICGVRATSFEGVPSLARAWVDKARSAAGHPTTNGGAS